MELEKVGRFGQVLGKGCLVPVLSVLPWHLLVKCGLCKSGKAH